MKTNRIYLLLAACLLTFPAQGQNYFTLDHNGTPSLYQILDSAIANAQDGDHIYLPGGAYNIGTVYITKEIHMFGAGYDPDSTVATGITYLVGNLILKTGADSSFLTGFDLNGYIQFGNNTMDQKLHNVTLTRLKCNSMKLGHTATPQYFSNNIFISECIIGGNIEIMYVQNILVEHCIITGYIDDVLNNAIFKNNIFTYNHTLAGCSDRGPLGNEHAEHIAGALFENNIFFDTNPLLTKDGGCIFHSPLNSTFNNNFFAGPVAFPFGTNVGISNVTDSVTGIIANPCTTYTNSCDFHLIQGSVCANAGSDGTDIGIYGTLQPFKEGAIPINPHIRTKAITSQDNTIYLNINVSAQDR